MKNQYEIWPGEGENGNTPPRVYKPSKAARWQTRLEHRVTALEGVVAFLRREIARMDAPPEPDDDIPF